MLSKSPAFTDEQWAACVEMVKTLMTSPRTSYEDFQAIRPAAGFCPGPEFGDHRAVRNLYGLSRSHLYALVPARGNSFGVHSAQRRAARPQVLQPRQRPAFHRCARETTRNIEYTEAKRGVSAAEDQRPVPRAERGGVIGDRRPGFPNDRPPT